MLRTTFLRGLVCVIALLGAISAQAAFTHPGVFSTKAELDYVKARIANREQPWRAAYDSISSHVNPNYRPSAVAKATSQAQSDLWMEDANQAYNFALLWYFSGNTAYANKAIEILNAWNVFQVGWNDINVDWGAADLYAAAEIIRYSNAGWKDADVTKFVNMTKTYLLPEMFKKNQSDNRLTTKIRSAMAVYVFLDDQNGFNQQVTEWKRYTPIYVRADGTSKETCRDTHHVYYGLEGTMQAAQIAYNQGVDLYAVEQSRLVKFLELYSGWMTGDVPVPSSACSTSDSYTVHPGLVACRSSGTQYHNPPCLVESTLLMDKPYVHYADRLGQNMPRTKKYNDKIRASWPRMLLQDYLPLQKGSSSASSKSSAQSSKANASSSAASSKANASSSAASSKASASSSAATVSSCQRFAGDKIEVDFSKVSCIEYAAGMTGRTLQVWDSDAQTCDFRGTITSMDGTGSLSVTGNFADSKTFTGKKLNFTPNNGCKYALVRVF